MPTSDHRGISYLLQTGGSSLMFLGFVARLPTAMSPMLLLIAIPMAGGNLVQASTALGVLALGTAASGPIIGVLIDRFGGHKIVLTIAIVQAGALISLGAGPDDLSHEKTVIPIAFFLGLSNPAIGALARAEWGQRIDKGTLDPQASRTAFSWEAAASEIAFVLGPVSASLLIGLTGPREAVMVLALVGFFVHVEFARRFRLPASANQDAQKQSPKIALRLILIKGSGPYIPLALIAAISIAAAIGTVFGVVQASLNSILNASNQPTLVGPVYGLLGVGSIVGGLLWAQVPNRYRGVWIVLLGGIWLTIFGLVAASPLHLNIPIITAICFGIGLALSPMLAEAHNHTRSHRIDSKSP